MRFLLVHISLHIFQGMFGDKQMAGILQRFLGAIEYLMNSDDMILVMSPCSSVEVREMKRPYRKQDYCASSTLAIE